MTLLKVQSVQDDLTQLESAELEQRAAELRERMRPLEENLAGLRGQRDVFLTELRRRRRLAERTSRADLKALWTTMPTTSRRGVRSAWGSRARGRRPSLSPTG